MEYLVNRETQKAELHFDKSEYMALSAEQQSEIKSAYLFSRTAGAWVSRAKFPNLWKAEKVAKSIGAEMLGKVGEALTFEEQMNRKAERAEARAERYEQYAANAEERAKNLQKPINEMHGDNSFFTQPNINSSAGRAFSNRRAKMFAAYDRGFEEFKKSEYFLERAETARETAAANAPTDKAFCDRRVKDAQKEIRSLRKLLEDYEQKLQKIENGETVKRFNGEIITAEEVSGWIEDVEERIEAQLSKEIFYRTAIEKLGGIIFSKENLKPGDFVIHSKYGKSKVVRCGPKNCTLAFTQSHMTYADGTPMQFKAPYAEIKSLVTA